MKESFWYHPVIYDIFQRENINISEKFMIIATDQLFQDFYKKTGIKDTKSVKIGYPLSKIKSFEVNVQNGTSGVIWSIFVIASIHPATICWKSKSGRVYKISDTDIDEEDIEFWFEGLDPVQIYKDLYPKFKVPFQLKDLYFEVNIRRLDIDLKMAIHFNKGDMIVVEQAEKLILDFVDDWNRKAEKDINDEKGLGVVHSCKAVKKESSLLELQFDMGSASVTVLKKIIQMLNKKTTDIKSLTVE